MSDPRDILPQRFVERLREIVDPTHFDEVLASFSRPKRVSFRVNTLKADVGTVAGALADQGFELESVPWFPEAFLISAEQKRQLTETSQWEEGQIYIQGLSSMLAPLVLAPQPDEKILDLAAAPGGKTTQIAAAMQNRGLLSAVEPIRNRFFRLQANVKRSGAEIVKFYQADGRTVGRKTPARFDRVMLDAPCSSESRFTTGDPESWAYWSERKIKEAARKQFGLLRSALDAVRPGGIVLYCTCSFAPEENELIVSRVLDQRHDVELLPIDLPIENTQPGLTFWSGKEIDPRFRQCVRVLPNADFDGFFLARLTRTL